MSEIDVSKLRAGNFVANNGLVLRAILSGIRRRRWLMSIIRNWRLSLPVRESACLQGTSVTTSWRCNGWSDNPTESIAKLTP